MIEEAQKLKSAANKLYLEASKFSKERKVYEEIVKQSCVVYGQAIELILNEEINFTANNKNADLIELKLSLFMNLSLVNIQLNGFEGALKCCNAAIQLCNNPELLLCELESSDIHQSLFFPVSYSLQTFVPKILYRRAVVYLQIGNFNLAQDDILLAYKASPNDKKIIETLNVINKKIIETKRTTNPNDHILVNSADNWESISMTNGSKCWNRKGKWDQAISELNIYLKCSHILQELSFLNSNIVVENFKTLIFADRVEFEPNVIGKSFILKFRKIVIPTESYWTINRDIEFNFTYISLHVQKNNILNVHCSVDGWYPGCEWWDSCFEDDETIETLSCSAGTDLSQLPRESSEKTEKEIIRWNNLSEAEKRRDFENRESTKKSIIASQLNTRAAVDSEDRALEECPERSQMLEALRKEFPAISFSSK